MILAKAILEELESARCEFCFSGWWFIGLQDTNCSQKTPKDKETVIMLVHGASMPPRFKKVGIAVAIDV